MFDRNVQRRNLSQGYTLKETLEMIVDLFNCCFDSDGDNYYMLEQIEEKGHAVDWKQKHAVDELWNQLKDKLDDNARIE